MQMKTVFTEKLVSPPGGGLLGLCQVKVEAIMTGNWTGVKSKAGFLSDCQQAQGEWPGCTPRGQVS